jgi:hypothetical protein
MSQILIKGTLINKVIKTNEHMTYFIYQFQVLDKDNLLTIINVHSRTDKNIVEKQEIELPISVSSVNNELFFEFING